MDRLFLAIINISITGGFVIAIISLTRLLLKKSPKVISYCLWAVVGIRLLLPFSIESGWSIVPFGAQPVQLNTANYIARADYRLFTVFDINSLATIEEVQTAITSPSAPHTIDMQTITVLTPHMAYAPSINTPINWISIGGYAWLVGVIIMLTIGIASYLKLKRKAQKFTHIYENIYEGDSVHSPFVLGFVAPKIHLPMGLLGQDRMYVILHEQIHIRRFDHIIKLLAYLILCIHWFNPFAWLAFKLMSMDMEMSCDERVLKEMGVEEAKKGYSLSLVSLATEKLFVVGSPLAFGENGIKERVTNVLNFKKPSKLVSLVSAMLVFVLSLGLMLSQADVVMPPTPQYELYQYNAPVPPPEEPVNLPMSIRTLTIRNSNQHTGVINQAAAAMNAVWREQNKPYIFHVEIDDYPWTDFKGAIDRHSHLQAELLAGQGPDMFLFDQHNIHNLISSGFLQNFYTLMDACRNTSRDEFFTQALQAFELNNGLYLFPTSFGFEYVAINTKLPQEFISRFTQKSTISHSQMMEFYLDLVNAHGDEFGHLSFNVGSGITSSYRALQAIIGGFTDFNARTANLTNPRFIETLELMGTIYDGWDVAELWVIDINTAEFLQERAKEYVFNAINSRLSSFDAFFMEETPIFTHHIPLVDDHGRLLIGMPDAHGQVWSGICITATADGALAWEFTRHIIYAYTNPDDNAATEPVYRSRNMWGRNSLATPILRSLSQNHTLGTFESAYNTWHDHGLQNFVGFNNPVSRALQFENAVDRIAAYNEQPMGMLSPMIPENLLTGYFLFLDGLIDAETAAYQMQNAISQWLAT